MGVILLIHPEIMTWWNLLTCGVQAHSLLPSHRFRLEPLNDTDHMFQWHHFNPVYGLIKKLPCPSFPQDKWWFIAKFVWAAPVSRCCYSHSFWGSVDWTDNWNPIFFGMNLETSHWNWTWSPKKWVLKCLEHVMTVFCPAGNGICKDDSCLTLVELHHSKFPAPAVQGSTVLWGPYYGCPKIQDNWNPIWLEPHLRLIMSSVLRVTSRFMANHKYRSFNFPSLSSHLQSQVYPLVISQFATESNDFQVREQNHNRTEPCFFSLWLHP